MDMMKKAQELQAKVNDLQEELRKVEIAGSAGGDMVAVTLSGKGEMRGIKIDKSLIADGDVEIIEDLIMAAHNDAKSKVEAHSAEKMAEVTSGLPIPAGMKLPF